MDSKIDKIETHIYPLTFTIRDLPNGYEGKPYASCTVSVPFVVKKIVFKPINCYFIAEVAGSEFKPFLAYCDLVDNTRSIGYSGHIASALPAVGGSQGQWVAVNNDITFTLRSPKDMQNTVVNFWLGAALNAGQVFTTVPFTGVVVFTVEYHSIT